MQGGEEVGVEEGVSQQCPNDTTTLDERGGMRLKHAADGVERGIGWKMVSHSGVLMTQRQKERGDETETCCPVGRE